MKKSLSLLFAALLGFEGATAAPTVVRAPIPRTVPEGGSVELSVAATGSNLTYQWLRETGPLAGATKSTLNLQDVKRADAGRYSVQISDTAGSVIAGNVTLTVRTPDALFWNDFNEERFEMASPAHSTHDGQRGLYLTWDIYEWSLDMVGGQFVGPLARLDDTTGQPDRSFDLGPRLRRVTGAVAQPDGKMIVAGDDGEACAVIRVDRFGNEDPSFRAPKFDRGLRFITRQPDGKVLLMLQEQVYQHSPVSAMGVPVPSLVRLNADGSVDASFRKTEFDEGAIVFGPPVLDASGRIYVTGAFGLVNGSVQPYIARLSPTGTLDTNFARMNGYPGGAVQNPSSGRNVVVQSDGRVVVAGRWIYPAKGTAANAVAAIRFNADGTFDTTFPQPLVSPNFTGGMSPSGIWPRAAIGLPDDSVLLGNVFARKLTAAGAFDASFSTLNPGNALWVSRSADGRFFFPDNPRAEGSQIDGVAVYSSAGQLDSRFQAGGWGQTNFPTEAVVFPDGSAVVAGDFSRFGGTRTPGVARLKRDGTLLGTTSPYVATAPSASVASAGSGRVYIFRGDFYDPTKVLELQRLNSDLTPDASFALAADAKAAIAKFGLQTFAFVYPAPNGGVYAISSFPQESDVLAQAGSDKTIVRINADGSLDTGFVSRLPQVMALSMGDHDGRIGEVRVLATLANSQLLVATGSVDGSVRLYRLQQDGSVDTGFNAPVLGQTTPSDDFGLSGKVFEQHFIENVILAAQPLADGTVIIGGNFQLGGAPYGLAKLRADGSLDASFAGAGISHANDGTTPYVTGLAVDVVGRIYAAGRFDKVNGVAAPGLARMSATGVVDAAWQPDAAVIDYPRADARLTVQGSQLYIFGTVGRRNDRYPSVFQAVQIPGPLPVIATSPVSASAIEGSGVSLTVNATGGALTYQWRRDGQPIVGATGSTYTISSLSSATTGQYDVVVTNVSGSIATVPATVAIENRVLDAAFQPPPFVRDVVPNRVVLLSDGSYLHFFNTDSLSARMTGSAVKYLSDGQLDFVFRFPVEAGQISAACAAAGGGFYAASVASSSDFTLDRRFRYTVARYRSDGAPDSTWVPVSWLGESGAIVRALNLADDGRLMATGFFTDIGGSGRQGVARFNANGGLDDSFDRVVPTGGSSGPSVWSRAERDPAGNWYIGGDFTAVDGQPRPGLARLTPDGRLDPTFVPSGFTRAQNLAIRGIAAYADGKVIIGGRFTVPGQGNTPLLRLTANGARDPSGPIIVFSDDFIFAVRDLVKLGEQRFVVASNALAVFDVASPTNPAEFDTIPSAQFGQPRFFLDASTVAEATSVEVTPEGGFLAAGTFALIKSYSDSSLAAPRAGLARFDARGTLQAFAPAPMGRLVWPGAIAPLADGSLIVRVDDSLGTPLAPLGYAHLRPDGSPGSTLTAIPPTFFMTGLAQYPNGSVALWDLGGATGVGLMRVLADGSPDPSLPFTGNASLFTQLVILPDGRGLTTTTPILRNTLVAQTVRRFASNGNPDTGFQFNAPEMAAAEVRSAPTAADTAANRPGAISAAITLNLRVLATNSDGSFFATYLGSDGTVKVARHTAAGARDTAFALVSLPALPTTHGFTSGLISDPQRPGAPGVQVDVTSGPATVLAAVALPDGGLVIGGKFTTANGQPAPGILWLTATGARDATRMAAIGAGAQAAGLAATDFPRIEAIVRDSAGRITVAGTFDRWNNQPAGGLVQLNSDGAVNSLFGQPLQRITALGAAATLTATSDDSIYLTGPYRGLGEPYPRQIWRLLPIRTKASRR